jgi:hypothetical protein
MEKIWKTLKLSETTEKFYLYITKRIIDQGVSDISLIKWIIPFDNKQSLWPGLPEENTLINIHAEDDTLMYPLSDPSHSWSWSRTEILSIRRGYYLLSHDRKLFFLMHSMYSVTCEIWAETKFKNGFLSTLIVSLRVNLE